MLYYTILYYNITVLYYPILYYTILCCPEFPEPEVPAELPHGAEGGGAPNLLHLITTIISSSSSSSSSIIMFITIAIITITIATKSGHTIMRSSLGWLGTRLRHRAGSNHVIVP